VIPNWMPNRKTLTELRAGIVVEDAPSGIRAGVAAGSRVLAVCTSHTRQQLEGHGATWIVEDLRE
jgi:beta-phosphoglucomutase-like phosphatase (HAD superfamily)